ncbi:mobilization protein [Escherichia coli]|nr:mobilization protein [Escherichia coli]
MTSNETKIRDAIALFHSLDRGIAGKTPGRGERGDDAAQEGRVKAGGEYGHDVTGDQIFLCLPRVAGRSGILEGIRAELEEIRKQEETLQKLNAKTWGVEFVQDGAGKFLVLPYGKSAEVIPFQGKSGYI